LFEKCLGRREFAVAFDETRQIKRRRVKIGIFFEIVERLREKARNEK